MTAELVTGWEPVLVHAQVLPNPTTAAYGPTRTDGGERPPLPDRRLEGLHAVSRRLRPAGQRLALDDADARLPHPGHAFIEKARALGIKVICAHKGFGAGSRYASSDDVPRAAKDVRDVRFIVYHAGFERIGPYTAATANVGINRLITAMKRHGVGPNQNVYAELGSTWWTIMRDPEQAAHVLGKLLKHVGEDNVLWGTDGIFYGSPQGQIQTLRAFQISEEFQARFGTRR